jgi:hypothetical protein
MTAREYLQAVATLHADGNHLVMWDDEVIQHGIEVGATQARLMYTPKCCTVLDLVDTPEAFDGVVDLQELRGRLIVYSRTPLTVEVSDG